MLTKKVLLVEDDVVTAKIIATHLKALDYIVTAIVVSEREAIAAIETEKPDLVLMDIHLGTEANDGIAIATRVRNQFQIPVVYLTASQGIDTFEQAKSSTPFGYITKPCSQDDLSFTIEVALHRHQIEQQLVAQNTLLSTILNSTGDGVVAVDSEGHITYMNPAAESITGSSIAAVHNETIGNVMSFASELTHKPVVNPLIQAMELQRVCYLNEYTILIAKDGREVPIVDSASPIFKVDGGIDGAVLVFSNISDRRKSQQLEIERAKLETQIFQQEQVETAIRRALKKAEELSDLQTRFLSIVSHELRNPLTSILLSADLAELYVETWPADKMRQRLRRISNNVRRATDIIEDILLLGKTEFGTIDFNPSSIDLVAYCQDVANEMQLASASSIADIPAVETIFSSTSEQYLAYVDEKLLQQIFPNLLSNAIKYSTSGSTVLFNLDCTPDMMIFRIIDSGIGIPEAEIPFLFQPFRRGSNVGDIRGTGVGLAIVKRAVELHGGQFYLETKLGEGTTFTVVLPILQPDDEISKSSAQDETEAF
jgi:PAS domain S-box-containing protein